MQPRLKHWTWR